MLLGLCLGPAFFKVEMPTWLSTASNISGGVFLFLAGWEIRFLDLRREARFFAICFFGAFGVPFLAGYLLFDGHLFIAAALGISALPVAIQILREKQRYDSELGRKTVTLAGLCDLAAWLILFFVFPSASAGNWLRSHWFVLMFFIGLALGQLRSMPSAAFRLQKWILAPLFFIGLGWRLPFLELFDLSVFLKIAAIAVIAKLVGVYLTARMLQKPHIFSLELAMLLNARGAMEIVAAHAAYSVGVIDGGVFTGLVALGILTSVMAIPFVRHNSKVL